MDYICTKRLKKHHLSGNDIIPSMTKCTEQNGLIYLDCKPICYTTSQIAHDHFSRNDDGKGMERGRLVQEIQHILSKPGKTRQKRWDAVWGDGICQKYKRADHEDFWLWNHEFYNLVKKGWQNANSKM